MNSTLYKLLYWIIEKYAFFKTILLFAIILCCLLLKIIKILLSRRYINRRNKKNITVGFFHPNCNAFTRSEMVLWSAVKAIQVLYDNNVQICIYTGDSHVNPEVIFNNVESKFNIKLKHNIQFIHLRQEKWIKRCTYLGSMWVACEALMCLKPHIIIDTMGYGFTNFIFKYIGGCNVINYIHNPIVPIEKLKKLHTIYNKNQYVLTRRPASILGYNKGIAFLYGWTGRAADIVMVNSLWTEENINVIWKCPERTYRVYPPIGLEKLMEMADCWDEKKEFRILNATEFKSEHNHELILQAFGNIRFLIKPNIMDEVRLVLINLSMECDELYLQKLKDLILELDLQNYVKIYPEYTNSQHLQQELIKASYGIYARANDNFGSDIIAGFATGQIMIVHASGAAKNELIYTDEESRNGFLAKTIPEYTETLVEVLNLSPKKKRHIQKAARSTAEQFSCLHFQKNFLKLTETFYNSKK